MAASISSEHLDLEDLFQKATDPSSETTDELAIHLFCSTVRADPTLIKKSTELIVSKVKSTNVTQSRKAIELLEECMSKCGSEFQLTIARFQFLNELIRLVSKKFAGDDTPIEIRNKILDCLSLWTVQYPERTKIKEAYETLLRSGVQHEVTPTISTTGRRTNFIDDENEKLLKKLLKSNNREDLQRANLLIQYLVKQDTKKAELAARQRMELQEARNSAMLLNQFVNRWVQDEVVEDQDIAKEIYNLCQKSKNIVIRMPETIEDNEELLGDAIEVNDILAETMIKYEQLHTSDNLKKTSTREPIDFPDLISPTDTNISSANPLDELSDIFSNNLKTSLSTDVRLLEPVFFKNTVATSSIPEEKTKNQHKQNSTNNRNRTLSTIDSLSDELFKESFALSERIGTFKKEPNKVPIKNLIKEKSRESDTKDTLSTNSGNTINMKKTDAKCTPQAFSNDPDSILDGLIENTTASTQNVDPILTCLDPSEKTGVVDNQTSSSVLLLAELLEIDNLSPETKTHSLSSSDNATAVVVDYEEIVKFDEVGIIQESVILAKEEVSKKDIKHLSEINIELNSIQPSNERPRVVMDDIQGLRVTLNFALDRPSRNVSVIVISTINQSSLPIDKYQFEASVKKPCKLRLLAPTGNSLPGVKPFRPPTDDIQQILLLFNPTQLSVDLTCIIGYQQGDDPDPIKESVIVKDISYCE